MAMSPIMKEIYNLKLRLNDAEQRISEFYDMLHEIDASNIDYLAMESGIDLDQEDSANE